MGTDGISPHLITFDFIFNVIQKCLHNHKGMIELDEMFKLIFWFEWEVDWEKVV